MTIPSPSNHANNTNSPNSNNPARSLSSAYAQFPSSPVPPHSTSLLPLFSTVGATPGSPTPLALDMKRLLAKPAPPYAHTHGRSNGSSSESEGFSGADSSHRKSSLVPVPRKVGRSRSLQSLLPDRKKERGIDATTPEKDNRKSKEKRPRNVLRRRPSTQLQSHMQKSSPALPETTTTTVTATAFPLPSLNLSLHSPLPPLTPRSPLSPSMFPSSPASANASTSFPLGPRARPRSKSSPRPSTAPSPSHPPTRLVSSFDKPLPPTPTEENGSVGPESAQPRHECWGNDVGGVVQEYVVNVTDEKGKNVDPRRRLRELKGTPVPSPSPSPSRSHSPSSKPRHQPHHLSAPSSLNDHSSSRSRSRSRNPPPIDTDLPSASQTSTSLTPAAAVVAAYKRQTLLDEASMNERNGVSMSGSDSAKKAKKRPHTSAGHGRSATEPQPRRIPESKIKDDQDIGKHQPYYTVVGTSSERVVAAGGPEDRHHISWENVPPLTLAHKPSVGGGLRTLTRKVSGHFKRAVNGTQSEGEERDKGERRRVSMSTEKERGRPSFSGTRAASGKRGDKGGMGISLRLSIDKFAEARAVRGGAVEGKDTPPTSSTKSRGSGASTPSPSGGGSGNKLWKLMKRISTGALREKFVYDGHAPPVPSLPKEYAAPAPAADPMAKKDDRLDPCTSPLVEGFGKAVRKKASIVLGVGVGVKVTSGGGKSPITNPTLPSSPLATQAPFPAARPSPPPPAPRPSTTTRSSSPMSSDVGSSRFFAGYKPSSTSAHSSTSSLPIEDNTPLPPLPHSVFSKHTSVGHYIVPPSELRKMCITSDEAYARGPEGTEDSLTLSSPRNPTPTSTSTSSRTQMKLRLVVPSTPSSPVEMPRGETDNDDYLIPHTPASEMASLPLPPRRPGVLLGRRRRDTYASIMAEAGWGAQGAKEEITEHEVENEERMEWDRIWESSNAGKELDDEAQSLDSRSGSPMIPSFSTTDPINTFPKHASATASRRSPSTTTGSPSIIPHHRHALRLCPEDMGYSPGIESLPLPPRPARSPQRPASTPTQSSQTTTFLRNSNRYSDEC
ncbi:hypothetical protein C0995_004712 [Termitomyces sp. Mi166|nr:hypothetical protein C0995_004712 [Termitomyces sp. Mi166\